MTSFLMDIYFFFFGFVLFSFVSQKLRKQVHHLLKFISVSQFCGMYTVKTNIVKIEMGQNGTLQTQCVVIQ